MEYAVIIAEALRERVLDIQRRAADAGVGDRFLAALRTATGRLRTNPLDFGEVLYHLPELHWPVHLAIAAPLALLFTVHEAERQVWVVNAHALSGHGV